VLCWKDALERQDHLEVEQCVIRLLKSCEPPSPGDSIGRNWEPAKLAYLTIAVLLRECSVVFATESVVELLLKWLEPNLPCGLSNSVLACSCLNTSLKSAKASIPIHYVEVLVKDILESGSSHRWNDHPECRMFVQGVRSVWDASALEHEHQRTVISSMLDFLRQRATKLESIDTTSGSGGILSLLKV
jgi:hypothetical protein